ncbi:protein of unknown function [Pseudomonas sp. JV551A1]|uniref:Uncharacterized protein n=1 Tax=Pseudomonas inefficax TaxID=2078786 RepID=A0AAQ1P7Z8_9PSED|nr:protein of unknown function [Pseudomonas sp. JV551A1]SPO59434.1 protein of unknown function [Pseudomonas inefficax]
MAGFSGVPGLVGTAWNYVMVPRGRLELPLLSKTDFESAASTNSAIRACGAQYREPPLVGQSAFMVNFHTLG